MWNPLRDILGPRSTLAFDAPGSGLSPAPLRQPTIAALAHGIAAGLDAIGIDAPDVLGYSFGGAVAQELARCHPARVHRLVLAATSPGWGAPPPSPMALADLLTPARYYVGPMVNSLMLVARGASESPATFARLQQARRHRPPTLYGYWWQLAAISAWSSLGWLGELDVPCLVITGEHDQVAGPASAEVLANAIPGARLVIAPEAGHLFLYSDQVHPVVNEITAFLDGWR